MTPDDVICGPINLDGLSRDNFRVETTLGFVGKPCNKCLLIKSLSDDNEAESLIAEGLSKMVR